MIIRDVCLSLAVFCCVCGQSFAAETTITFAKYEEEGSEICSVTFKADDSTFLEITDGWTEHGPQLYAYAYRENATWMKIQDIDAARIEVQLMFDDNTTFLATSVIDDYSGRPYISITPDMFYKLLTVNWRALVDGKQFLQFTGPPASSVEKEFLKCVNNWKLQDEN